MNCLDRHVRAGRGEKIAYYFEGEPGDRRTITYRELLDDVCRFANGLRKLGIRKGDRVAIYMPMIPELPVAMLACARIGAAHSVIFGGFSPESIVDRVNDAQCVALITCDWGWRRGKKIPLKRNCDVAMEQTPSIRHCIVAGRIDDEVFMREGRDHCWNEVVAGQPATCEPEAMNAEDLLFLLYTSGTTAKPKGIKHTTAGYLTHVDDDARSRLRSEAGERRLLVHRRHRMGDRTFVHRLRSARERRDRRLYEGTPDFPDEDRFWEIVERYSVTILYTAPTAIRTFMKWGTEYPAKHDLSSLRLLGTVGEPINPEAWMWYREWIGGNRTPVVDTWWQTETGGIMISPLPGVTTLRPGSATQPFPGIAADIVDEHGKRCRSAAAATSCSRDRGRACCAASGATTSVTGRRTGRSFPHVYLAGDGCRRDADGNYWFMGRIDDVMNVSGHRISTTEVESALVDHPRSPSRRCAENSTT